MKDFGPERSFQSLGFCGNRIAPDSLEVFYLRCKQVFYNTPTKDGRSCSSDTDCVFEYSCDDGACLGLGRSCDDDDDCVVDSSCNYFSGTCTGEPEVWEEMFFGCFILNLPVSVGDQVANIYGIPPLGVAYSGSQYLSYFESLLEGLTEPDCVSDTGVGMDGLLFRNRVEATTASSPGSSAEDCRCTEVINRTFEFCFDEECVLPRECLFGVYQPCLVLFREIERRPGSIPSHFFFFFFFTSFIYPFQ